jgi:hypothetical protein
LPRVNVLSSRNQTAEDAQVTVATWFGLGRPPLEI